MTSLQAANEEDRQSLGQSRPLHIGDKRTRRLIIVGDIHGHLAELKQLLTNIGFDKEAGDHVILVGDLVNKGPDSPGVVQYAMDIGAVAVKGNNEDRVLIAVEALKCNKVRREDALGWESQPPTATDKTLISADTSAAANRDPYQARERNEVLPNLLTSDFETATSLTESQLSWLASLPIILDLGHFVNATQPPWNSGSVVVAHAGLVPGLSLDRQDPWAVMNMRSLVYPPDDFDSDLLREGLIKAARKRVRGQPPNWPVTDEEMDEELTRLAATTERLESSFETLGLRETAIPIETSDGDLWREAWNRRQNKLQDSSERIAVVYGHDAKAGLQVEPLVDIRERGQEDGQVVQGVRYTFGLDSGCVYGKHLTALIIEARAEDGSVVHRIEQVGHIKTDSSESE
ncbi:Metallo-dependent phosphatase-like protein [Mariannaea sp. PMI_226]|nr:Metallo-dependent phosphatase-like protein [Mariannaea sp. PMI_226]